VNSPSSAELYTQAHARLRPIHNAFQGSEQIGLRTAAETDINAVYGCRGGRKRRQESVVGQVDPPPCNPMRRGETDAQHNNTLKMPL